MDRQGVGLAQKVFEARRPVDAERQLDPVRQVGIVESDPEIERLGAQRHRRPDAAEADDPESLHTQSLDQRMLERAERRRRVMPLHLVVEENAAAQCQGQRDRMVGNLGRAVIGDVADKDVALGGGRAVELVVADPHADNRAQPWESAARSARVTANPMIISPSASAQSASESSDERPRIALDDTQIGAENLGLQMVGLLAGLGIEHGDGHRHSSRLNLNRARP